MDDTFINESSMDDTNMNSDSRCDNAGDVIQGNQKVVRFLKDEFDQIKFNDLAENNFKAFIVELTQEGMKIAKLTIQKKSKKKESWK